MSPFQSVACSDKSIAGVKTPRGPHLPSSAAKCLALAAFLTLSVFCQASFILADTYISGDITSDTTWTKVNSPYIVTGDIVVYHSNYTSDQSQYVTLTIEPGVEVRFNARTGLNIGKSYYNEDYTWGYSGALTAQGTEAEPILFTANSDTPTAGFWSGIRFRKHTRNDHSILEHCRIECGGGETGYNLYIYKAEPTIRSCVIENSSGSGIYIAGESPSIQGNTIQNNASHGIVTGSGCEAVIQGNTIQKNVFHGIMAQSGSRAAIEDNLITDNGGRPITNLNPDAVRCIGSNEMIGNGQDGILITAGEIATNGTWKKHQVPYVIDGDIIVCHTSITNDQSQYVTLTIEPGVEIRFNAGTGLNIGKVYAHEDYARGYSGALTAQGTEAEPILFVANSNTPEAGFWDGIRFHKHARDDHSIIEHCTIEYGGQTNNANVYIYKAKPTLRYNTIRYSSYSGIYVSGDESDGIVIDCNNLKDNLYGIYTADGAQPNISGNNFLRNQNYGIYNAHSQTVTANGNWWNDANGPNTNGDGNYGSVTADTWLTAESDCVTAPPTNTAPYTPRNPTPLDNAVRVPVLEDGAPVAVTLSWSGGDPNPWDTVIYDLYFGQAADNLALAAASLTAATYAAEGLDGGKTYCWQVIARDDAGAETSGPVWKFTTLGDPPDLEVSQVTLDPDADLVAGQSVTFIATIANTGSGPVVDGFTVSFAIDGSVVGTRTVSPVIAAGGNATVSLTWTAVKGTHSLTVTADSSEVVDETYDDNNTLIVPIPEVIDTTAPVLSAQSPAAGAVLQSPSAVSVTLADAHGSIDDAAVIASMSLTDAFGAGVSGTTTEVDDVFTFTPAILPLADGTYTFAFDAVDDSGNMAHFSFIFTVDGQAPAAPVITGGAILSGTLTALSDDNRSNTTSITVTGIRERDTAVYINGTLKVALGSMDWSAIVDLDEGENSLEIWVRDAAGNDSPSVPVTINVDSIPPIITDTVPAADSYLNVPPVAVTVSYQETGSGLDTTACTASLEDGSGGTVSGNIDYSAAGTVVFTPAPPLVDGEYTLLVELQDQYTNRSRPLSLHFTVDTQPPAAPVVEAVTTPTHNPSQTITGTKEAGTAIYLGDQKVVDFNDEATWQYTATLQSGQNSFSFTVRDRAGNSSEAAVVTIVFDDIAPDPVTTLSVDGAGSGTEAALNWSGYDESVHGDVTAYRIYWQEGAGFSDVSSMTVQATVPAGIFTYNATGMAKGATVYFAVAAVDVMGNSDSAVTAVAATLSDVEAPEDVTGLAVVSLADRLTLSWTASAASAGDLAGYRVYVDGAAVYTALGADQTSFTQTGLGAASAHSFRITALDDAATANESAGVSASGVTWLANPAGLAATPFSGYVELSWSASLPAAYVQQYRIFVSEADFSDVSSMNPAVTVTGTTAKVAGLTNGTAYFFAVAAVNTSGGMDPAVTTVSATPVADETGPEISAIQASGDAFSDGYVLSSAKTLSLTAVDPSGVSRVEFCLDGSLFRTDYVSPYTAYLDPADMDDGAYTLTIIAYDTLGNSQSVTVSFTTAMALPAAPVITTPADGTFTNQTEVSVAGTAEKQTEVKLYNNGSATGSATTAGSNGTFSLTTILAEGENRIQASATNRSGEGPLSAAVTVHLDTTLPSAPVAVTAQAKSSGVIRVSWQTPADSTVAGYNLYRAGAPFAAVSAAEKVNTGTITAVRFDDLPASDGTWYYRVTSLDGTSNESEPSELVSAVSDRTAPRAESIVYSPIGIQNPETGAMAPGTVNLVLTVSEALQATPFLSVTPDGGTPISVDLTQSTDLVYTGLFVISETCPSGTAWAVFSGRDTVGNRGTEIDSGETILIDTDGPSVVRLVLTPQSPIQNDAGDPVTISAVLGLSEAVAGGSVPEVGYLLSREGREAAGVDSLTRLATADGDAETWQAVFVLPADAGASEAESLSLTFQAADDLGNVSGKIAPDNRFQVYQGDLPPLAAPEGLSGKALAGGRVALSWEAVADAAGYRLYRQGPGETEFVLLAEFSDAVACEDATETDGDYTYAVTSIRSENGQEAESGLSATVTVSADATAPGAPTDFFLELVASGIQASWSAPAYTEPITYRLYRAPLTEITDVVDLTPLADGIEQTAVVDPFPSENDHCYAVTAVDAAGNESPPSLSFYLNFDLLPVASLSVVQNGTEVPVVSWTHAGTTIAGYHIYLGSVESGVRLNDELLGVTSFTDTGWSGDARTYTVVAVDSEGVASLGRSITLPQVSATLAEGAVLRRGVMNRLSFTVVNGSSQAVSGIQLQVVLGGREHYSESFSLSGAGQDSVSVVVGGYEDLSDPAALTTTVVITTDANETVRIVREGEVAVADGMLVLQIANDTFTRGGTGSVWFSLENTGEESIEIVTALNSGAAASDQIAFTLLDTDENVIATKTVAQPVGAKIVTLADKSSVARIGAGEIFTAAATEIAVPSTAPDAVTVRLAIDKVYHDRGQDTEVCMAGLATTHEVSLEETAYVGRLVGIDPQSSSGGEDIVITGQAVTRADATPLGGVPLALVITHDGFESNREVYTDDAGGFSYTYIPESGAAGVFSVRVMHPDLTDKPVHGQFNIYRVAASPASVTLNIPRNYEQTVTVKVSAGEGTDVTNLHLEYLDEDQAGGQAPAGIHLSVGGAKAFLAGANSANLSFTLWGDNTAADSSTLVLRVASDGNEKWTTVTVRTGLSEAAPVLSFSPDHIETGLAMEESVTETVTLSNTGLAAMTDVGLSLLSADGGQAPAWAVLNGAAALGDLAVGEAREVSMTFSPPDGVSEGTYALVLRVTSANYAQTDINVYVSVTQSGTGDALFKVSDIYTGTLDSNLDVIQGLSGARVSLENEAVSTETYTGTTDSAGEALFEDLPVGRYKVRVTADNHQQYSGRTWVKAGITASQEVFLEYNLVTVEWSVTETTVEDEYEIVLTATYETSVPAAVVGISPTSVSLPEMAPGDVYNGEITMTNYGLITAESLAFSLPPDDAYFDYELSGSLPETIGAGQSVTVAYRVTCLSSLEPDAEGTGGGCGTYATCMTVGYSYCCTNGVWTKSSVNHCWTRAWGDCSVTGSASGTSAVVISAGSAAGSTSGSYTPSSSTVSGAKCFPAPERKENFCLPCMVRDSFKQYFQVTGSAVNLWMREYTREQTDLAVKVPGGQIEVKRLYYDGAWHFDHLRHDLGFTARSTGTGIESIGKAGVVYEAATSASALFIHDIYRIAPTDGGYRWYTPDGEWKAFDSQGKMTAWGDRSGTIGTLVYEDGLVVGVEDRDGTRVLWYEYDGEGRLAAASDAAGRRTSYTYSGGLLTRVSDVLDYDTVFEYDDQNRLVATTDALGRTWQVAYDDYGHVGSVSDADGAGWGFEYDYNMSTRQSYVSCTSSSGMVKETWFNEDGAAIRVNVNGRTTMSLTQDGRDELVTGENGYVTRKDFDQWDNLTAVTYPDGSAVTMTYDVAVNRPTQKVDENGSVTRNTYDAAGNLVEKVEAAGTAAERTTAYTYDDDGNLLTVTVAGDDATEAAQTVMTYDDAGNLTAVTDPAGGLTQFTRHDVMGNVLEKIDARGKTWLYTYDNLGRLLSVTDPGARTTTHTYDAVGNRTETLDAAGRKTEFAYDGRNNLVLRRDHQGHESVFAYNTDNKLVEQTDAEGRRVLYAYDSEGRLVSTTDGHGDVIGVEYDDATDSGCATCGGVTGSLPSRIVYPTFEKQFGYDKKNRKVTEADIAGDQTLTTAFEYDDAGNLVFRTDKAGKTTAYTYDALNHLVAVLDPAGGQTRYAYDDRDNLVALTDAKDQTTTFAYDKANRLVAETRPFGAATVYTYDAAGNLVQKIDAKDQKTAYTYDNAGRLVEIGYYAASTDSDPAKTVTFAYDAVGNLTGYDDGTTSAIYTYNDLYRKTAESVNYGAFTLESGYTYYANGLKKTYTGPDAVTYEYLFDANNQLAAVQIPGAGSVTVSEYTWNRPAVMLLPGGSTKSFCYDPLMRIKQITAKDPAANEVLDYAYTYDAADNITSKATGDGDYAYTYDNLYRLTAADNPILADEAYTYDTVGNRLTSAATTDQWAYNENNELGGYDNTVYTYDVNGNMIERNVDGAVTRFFYNLEDRLERVEDGAGNVIASYYYDPFGRRLWKDVGGTRTYFHYSDEGLTGEYDAVGTAIKTYGYKPGSTWTTDPLFMKVGANYYFYQNDHLGTPQKMTSINGAVVWSATYTAFGEATVNVDKLVKSRRSNQTWL